VSKTIIRRTSAHEEKIARIFIVVVVVVVVIIIVILRFVRHSRHIDMSVYDSAMERVSVVRMCEEISCDLRDTSLYLSACVRALRNAACAMFVDVRVCVCVCACAVWM
jgi:hypothetical protein